METNEATFDHLRLTERLPHSLKRLALVRNLFDRTPERKHLSAIVCFVKGGDNVNYCFVDEHVVSNENDHPRLVCECVLAHVFISLRWLVSNRLSLIYCRFSRNTKGKLVQTTNNVPLIVYLKQQGIVVVPIAAKYLLFLLSLFYVNASKALIRYF